MRRSVFLVCAVGFLAAIASLFADGDLGNAWLKSALTWLIFTAYGTLVWLSILWIARRLGKLASGGVDPARRTGADDHLSRALNKPIPRISLSRLNGWQRLGVVLSVCWALFVVVVAAIDWREDHSCGFTHDCVDVPVPDLFEQFGVRPPERSSRPSADLVGSSAESVITERARVPNFARVASVLVAPPAAAWLAVYVVLWAVRWVRDGFRQSRATDSPTGDRRR